MVSTQESVKMADNQDQVYEQQQQQQQPNQNEADDQKAEAKEGQQVDPFEDNNYMKKLKVYADKLKISLDEIKSQRMSKNQLKRLVRNQVIDKLFV